MFNLIETKKVACATFYFCCQYLIFAYFTWFFAMFYNERFSYWQPFGNLFFKRILHGNRIGTFRLLRQMGICPHGGAGVGVSYDFLRV